METLKQQSHHPFPPASRVAIYLRDSGGETQELSTAQQQTALLAWLANHGLTPGQIFIDLARPGSSTVGREAFHSMIAHFRTGRAPEAGLLIWSYSRFSRDVDDAQFYRADLRRRGYHLHSLNDAIPDGPVGRLIEAALDWKNEQFLEDLSADVKRGLASLVRDHGCIPGTPPVGFIRTPVTIGKRRDGSPHIAHRWDPDPNLIPVIQEAFRLLISGASLDQIRTATHLYTTVSSYQSFFRNPLYTGRLNYGAIVIEDYCPSIIDFSTWTAAQTIIAARSQPGHLTGDNPTHPRRRNSIYLLSGLVHCALCGSTMSGMAVSRSTGSRYERYACSAAKARHTCASTPIPRVALDRIVIDELVNTILTPPHIAILAREQQRTLADRQEQTRRERRSLAARLSPLRRQIGNLTTAIADQPSRSLSARLAELENQETVLLAELQRINLPEPPPPSPSSDYLERLRTILTHETDLTILRPILHALIHRITAERDDNTLRLFIEHRLPPDAHPPPRDDIIIRIPINPSPLGALIKRLFQAFLISESFQGSQGSNTL
jgi:DNA invertase Pin-like site-specific DNA recombinase